MCFQLLFYFINACGMKKNICYLRRRRISLFPSISILKFSEERGNLFSYLFRFDGSRDFCFISHSLSLSLFTYICILQLLANTKVHRTTTSLPNFIIIYLKFYLIKSQFRRPQSTRTSVRCRVI